MQPIASKCLLIISLHEIAGALLCHVKKCARCEYYTLILNSVISVFWVLIHSMSYRRGVTIRLKLKVMCCNVPHLS